MSNLKKLCNQTPKVRMTIVYDDNLFDKAPESMRQNMYNAWRVTLKYKGRQLTTPFFGGSAVTSITSADVVSSLLLDMMSYESASSLEDFCDEFGMNLSEARQVYNACKRTAHRVRNLFGDDLETFLEASQNY